jgi:hypothetical protein
VKKENFYLMFVDYYNDIHIVVKQKAITKDAMEGKNPIVFLIF